MSVVADGLWTADCLGQAIHLPFPAGLELGERLNTGLLAGLLWLEEGAGRGQVLCAWGVFPSFPMNSSLPRNFSLNLSV